MHGAQDLLRVRTIDGREALVPFVAALVPEVDLAGGRVVIADRPGLVSRCPRRDEATSSRRPMRLYLTIFPDYLAPLQLSLPGKAVESGLLEVHVHDLAQLDPRPAPHRRRHPLRRRCRHGDEAGAVGRGLRRALDIDAGDTIVFTTPSGDPFNQARRRSWRPGRG